MEFWGRWTDRDLSRMELVAALLILVVLIGAFNQRMVKVFTLAERHLVNSAVTNINTALRYRYAIAMLRNDRQGAGELLAMNPIALLQASPELDPAEFNRGAELLAAMNQIQNPPPDNYRGEFDGLDYESLDKGAWYFNRTERALVYIIRNRDLFETGLAGVPRIEYRLVPDYLDVDRNGRFDAETDRLDSVTLRSISHYHWRL